MSVLSRGVRNAFRSPARTVAIVVILGLSIGLSFVMLVGHKSVQNKINATLASVGNTVNIAPAGYATGSTGNTYLTTTQLRKVAHLPYVVSLDETLPGSLPSGGATGQPAGPARRCCRPAPASRSASSAPTNPSTHPTSARRRSRSWPAHVIDGTADSDDAMVSTATAKKNYLKVGSTFSAYGAVFTVKAIYDSDTDSGKDTVIVPLATQQRLTHHERDVASAIATADSLTHLSDVTGEITIALGPAADVTSDIARPARRWHRSTASQASPCTACSEPWPQRRSSAF